MAAARWLNGDDLMWAAPRTLVALFGVTQPRTRVRLTSRLLSTVIAYAVANGSAAGAASAPPETTTATSTSVVERVLRSAPIASIVRRDTAGRAFHCELVVCAASVLLARRPLYHPAATPLPPTASRAKAGPRRRRGRAVKLAAAAVVADAVAWCEQALALVALEVGAHQAWTGDSARAGHAVLSVATHVTLLCRLYPSVAQQVCTIAWHPGCTATRSHALCACMCCVCLVGGVVRCRVVSCGVGWGGVDTNTVGAQASARAAARGSPRASPSETIALLPVRTP